MRNASFGFSLTFSRRRYRCGSLCLKSLSTETGNRARQTSGTQGTCLGIRRNFCSLFMFGSASTSTGRHFRKQGYNFPTTFKHNHNTANLRRFCTKILNLLRKPPVVRLCCLSWLLNSVLTADLLTAVQLPKFSYR